MGHLQALTQLQSGTDPGDTDPPAGNADVAPGLKHGQEEWLMTTFPKASGNFFILAHPFLF